LDRGYTGVLGLLRDVLCKGEFMCQAEFSEVWINVLQLTAPFGTFLWMRKNLHHMVGVLQNA